MDADSIGTLVTLLVAIISSGVALYQTYARRREREANTVQIRAAAQTEEATATKMITETAIQLLAPLEKRIENLEDVTERQEQTIENLKQERMVAIHGMFRLAERLKSVGIDPGLGEHELDLLDVEGHRRSGPITSLVAVTVPYLFKTLTLCYRIMYKSGG